jgi:hypothetical protein
LWGFSKSGIHRRIAVFGSAKFQRCAQTRHDFALIPVIDRVAKILSHLRVIPLLEEDPGDP